MPNLNQIVNLTAHVYLDVIVHEKYGKVVSQDSVIKANSNACAANAGM